MSTQKHLLTIEQLNKQYNEKDVLKTIDLTVNQGEFIVIIGPSGAGKSTLVRCINQLAQPTSGVVTFDGVPLTCLTGKRQRHVHGEIAMIFQHYNLVKKTNVIKNVLHGRLGKNPAWKTVLGLYTTAEKEAAIKLLETVGLGEHLYKKANTLSGGQMQRVGVSRALMQQPRLILADEPISSLDPTSATLIMDTIKKQVTEQDVTVIMNLHQIHYAKRYATRIIGLKAGEIVFDGAPELLTEALIKDIYEGNMNEVTFTPQPAMKGELTYAML